MPAKKRQSTRNARATVAFVNSLPLSKEAKAPLLAVLLGLPSLGGLLLVGFLFFSFYVSNLPRDEQPIVLTLSGLVLFLLVVFIVVLIIYLIKRVKQARIQRRIAWQRAMSVWSQSTNDNTIPKNTIARQLSPLNLEKFSVQLFAKMGYQVVHTGKTHDGGVDVHLTNPAGQTELIQCKQWNHPVGEPEIRDLYGAMMHERAVRGFVIAPGGFTKTAHAWANGKPIILADESEIGRLVYSAYGDKPGIN